MSTQRKPEYLEDLSDAAVHDYLERHPDFFERHNTLLGSLRLPHVTGGTVSLVERQVSVLRQKDLKLERKLKELLDVARANDALAGKIHKLALHLLGARDLRQALEATEAALRTSFGADHSLLVLFDDPESYREVDIGRFFRVLEREDPALAPFATFLGTSKPRCGQIRDTQRDFLFGNATDEVGSAALVPLGKQCRLGFLAIGSVDADRYHPAMSFDFLGHLGELVAEALKRY